jgi:hypothetical protein
MASPKKKWLRRKLQELEAQQVEPVVEEPVEKVAQKAIRRVRKK